MNNGVTETFKRATTNVWGRPRKNTQKGLQIIINIFQAKHEKRNSKPYLYFLCADASFTKHCSNNVEQFSREKLFSSFLFIRFADEVTGILMQKRYLKLSISIHSRQPASVSKHKYTDTHIHTHPHPSISKTHSLTQAHSSNDNNVHQQPKLILIEFILQDYDEQKFTVFIRKDSNGNLES